MIPALISSKRMDWKTPKSLYNALNKKFNFDFDPCPSNPEFNGLAIDWGNCNFVNPPYGKQIKNWIKKAYIESKNGKVSVLLIPSRTDTRYWHDYVMKANQVWFIKGRLKFDDQNSPAPFPCSIVIFNGNKDVDVPPELKSVDILAQSL